MNPRPIIGVLAMCLAPVLADAQTYVRPRPAARPVILTDFTLPRSIPSGPPALRGTGGEYLGNLSANPYDPNSTSNPYGQYGSPYSAQSIQNPYSTYGSSYSIEGARNPYTTGGPRIFASDGTYLGRLNANRFDPESVSNPYGAYGSRYSPTSIRNPYSVYGSPYSTMSPTNPYLVGSDDGE